MQLVNNVARRGFVIGWDPLKLGNALSCLATLFVLSRRTGLPTLFPYADRYGSLFASDNLLSRVFVPATVDEQALADLLGRLQDLLQKLPFGNHLDGTSFKAMGRAQVSGVVWFSKHEGYLQDWTASEAESQLKAFCRRGNGVVLSGSYWRQYTDMRKLRREGEALRKHLGPLHPSLLTLPKSRPDFAKDHLKIGLHVRHGDYCVWQDGRYFFELEAYRAAALAIHHELGDRPHSFELVSDQSVSVELFSPLPINYHVSDQFSDFAKLSECDVVVGPPSTFSTWAAFCGRAKRIVLTKERIANQTALISSAVDIPFPTGSYIPGDDLGRPV